jgi:hypothetical protein
LDVDFFEVDRRIHGGTQSVPSFRKVRDLKGARVLAVPEDPCMPLDLQSDTFKASPSGLLACEEVSQIVDVIK